MADTASRQRGHARDFIKADFDKAVYLDSVHADNLMSAYLNLGAEHWALRRRLMVVEAMLAEADLIKPADLEAYEPGPEEKAAWEAERDDFIERTFRVLVRDTAAIPTALPNIIVPAREAQTRQ